QMEMEEETREILLPNWQGSSSHGITIDQTDDGVFIKQVQQNSPAAKMGVVKEGDQVVSATVYFDNLQSGEVAQLLNSMGHHTVGLRLQRKGDRSPLPGQSWSHEVFAASSPEVVLSGDDEEYRRIYTTKIKPRLKSDDAVEAECGGMQSRTITVTKKVTAYTVDVTRRDGAKDGDVVGPDFKIRIPSQEISHATKTGPGITLSGTHLRTQMDPKLPESHVPSGETGKSVTAEVLGPNVSGTAFLGPRIDANGQMGSLDAGFHVKGPRMDGKTHVSVGKVKIPVLKMPKFGFAAAGSGIEAQAGIAAPAPDVRAPCMDVTTSSVHVTGPDAGVGGGKLKMPHVTLPKFPAEGPTVEVALPKGKVGPCEVDVGIPDVAIEGEWKGPRFKKTETPQISLSDVNLNLKGSHLKGDTGVMVPRIEGDAKGLGSVTKGLKVDVKGPDAEFGSPEAYLKGPGISAPSKVSMPDVDINVKGPKLKGEVDVSVPKIGGSLKGPQFDVEGPKLRMDVPDVDVTGPKVKMP
ncbi:AHNK protein, partial [Chauna torquata]|nr:AHNK protein [Chauna torquata]